MAGTWASCGTTAPGRLRTPSFASIIPSISLTVISCHDFTGRRREKKVGFSPPKW